VTFALIGVNHKTAPIAVREQLFLPPAGAAGCVRRLVDHELIDAGVLLSTCNRTELYADATGEDASARLLESFGWWPHELPLETWRRYAYYLRGEEALAHLFRVAAGLDSMVLGEAQILAQIKTALLQARRAGVLDARLEIILRGAIRAGKRTRSETELGRRPVSVSHAAVAKAGEVLGGLHGRGVLIVGAGSMSEIALRLLRKQGISAAYLTSRSIDRADRLSRPLGGQAIEFGALADVIDSVDLILSASDAPHQLFDARLVQRFQLRRGGRPLVIIDMAMPRDVDPGVGELPGVRLFNLDDLQAMAQTGREQRKGWMPAAERVVDEELDRTRRALRARDASATIEAVVRRTEQLRDGVLERHLDRLPSADGATREALRHLAEALTARLLHGPIRALRESPDPEQASAFINRAFELNEDPP
jgi:glutamyl-tRNA reductase